MTDCPECNKPLAEADRSCTHCGWPHEEEALAEQAAAAGDGAPAAAPKPMIYLATGVGVGLLVGIFIGSSLSKDPSAAQQAPASSSTAGSPAGAATAPPRAPSPIAVRLRELSWIQSSDKLCTGRFEVISAPPSVRVLKFAVTDAGGKVIGNDSVSAAKPVKPGTVLELGFEVGKCSEIDKWQVEVPETK